MDPRLYPSGAAAAGSDAIVHVKKYTETIDVASVAADTSVEQTFTVTGLQVGDMVICSPPALGVALGISGVRVTAANTIGIVFTNATAGALDPASLTWLFLAFRPLSL